MAVQLGNLIFLCIVFNTVSCAKILGIFPSPGYSQFMLGERLVLELVNRGHEVTVISPFNSSRNANNYTLVHVSGLVENVLQGSIENVDTSFCVCYILFKGVKIIP